MNRVAREGPLGVSCTLRLVLEHFRHNLLHSDSIRDSLIALAGDGAYISALKRRGFTRRLISSGSDNPALPLYSQAHGMFPVFGAVVPTPDGLDAAYRDILCGIVIGMVGMFAALTDKPGLCAPVVRVRVAAFGTRLRSMMRGQSFKI